jgi:hypothetical protein
MPLANPFENPRPLREFLARLAGLPRHCWLYVPTTVTEITLETPCYATRFDSRDLSPEEQDEFDSFVEQTGMRSLLCVPQLEEVQANLNIQHPEFSLGNLADAVDFYWKHDAFVDLSG